MELIPHNVNIDFVGKRFFFVVLSVVINIVSIILMLTWGLNYGLDFAGGAMIEVRFAEPTTSATLQQAVKEQPLDDLTIQDVGRDSKIFMLRFKQLKDQNLSDVSNAVQSALTAGIGQQFEVLRVESVGSKVSGELRRKGFLAVLFSTLLMGTYIALRFDLRFGLGAVIALIHDVLVVTGALTVTQTPFDLSVLAALLTVVGYSVHDTIIVSDRVRENMRKARREALGLIINRSVNETLSRTIITSGTAILVLVALFILGGHVIRPFAFTLIVGFITGTYSSIYIAAPVVLYFEKTPLLKKSPSMRTAER
jgi:preprotein translocase subunit SecF